MRCAAAHVRVGSLAPFDATTATLASSIFRSPYDDAAAAVLGREVAHALGNYELIVTYDRLAREAVEHLRHVDPEAPITARLSKRLGQPVIGS